MKTIFSLMILFLSINLMAADFDVVETKGPGGYAMVKTLKAKKDKVPALVGTTLAEVKKAAAGLKLKIIGAAFLSVIDNKDGVITFQTGYAVSRKLKNLVGFDIIDLPAGKVAQVEFTGSYADTYPGYNAIIKWLNDNKKEGTGDPMEFYLSDPKSVSPPNQKIKIIYPIK